MFDLATFRCIDENSVLNFWREKQNRWESLAKIAKKRFRRLFSIAGHIYSCKRRRRKARLFERLMYCKLNENLI